MLVVGVSDPDRNSELRGGRLAAPDPCLARLSALLLGGAHAHTLLPGGAPRLPPGHRFGIRPFRLLSRVTQISLNRPRREAHLAGPTKPVPAAERAGQLPLEGAAGQHIEIGINGFVRDPHGRVIRIPLR